MVTNYTNINDINNNDINNIFPADNGNNNSELLEMGMMLDALPEKAPLKPGRYYARVTGYKVGSFPGSAKLLPSQKVTVTYDITGDDDHYELDDDFIMQRKMAWRLSQFFCACGLAVPGAPFKLDFNSARGRFVVCEVIGEKYIGKDGREHTKMRIDRYLLSDKTAAEANATLCGLEATAEEKSRSYRMGAF